MLLTKKLCAGCHVILYFICNLTDVLQLMYMLIIRYTCTLRLQAQRRPTQLTSGNIRWCSGCCLLCTWSLCSASSSSSTRPTHQPLLICCSTWSRHGLSAPCRPSTSSRSEPTTTWRVGTGASTTFLVGQTWRSTSWCVCCTVRRRQWRCSCTCCPTASCCDASASDTQRSTIDWRRSGPTTPPPRSRQPPSCALRHTCSYATSNDL